MNSKSPKTYTDPNTHMPVILGSAIKGAMATAFQEGIFKQEGEQALRTYFPSSFAQDFFFRHLQVSDAKVLKQGALYRLCCQ